MASIYSYYYQDFSHEDSLPSLPYSLFVVKLRFMHLLQLSYPESIAIPCYESNETHTFPREQFLSVQEGSRIIASILSSTGTSPEIIESRVPDIFNFAWEMQITHNNGTDRRGLLMVINLLAKTPFDDREIIDRAIRESLMDSGAAVPRSMRPADKDAIQKLEKVKVQDLDSMTLCTICVEEFQEADYLDIVRMPCGHLYHKECIIKWLQTSNTCPLCRYEMPCSEN